MSLGRFALLLLAGYFAYRCSTLGPLPQAAPVAAVQTAAIYCQHELFGQYTFSSGQLARDVQAFITEWHSELRELRINRVGVYGRGEYATGVWYTVE
jgi:hypothetical protein